MLFSGAWGRGKALRGEGLVFATELVRHLVTRSVFAQIGWLF